MSLFIGFLGVSPEDAAPQGPDVGRDGQVADGGRLADGQQLDGAHLHQDRDHQPRRVLARLGQAGGRAREHPNQQARTKRLSWIVL